MTGPFPDRLLPRSFGVYRNKVDAWLDHFPNPRAGYLELLAWIHSYIKHEKS